MELQWVTNYLEGVDFDGLWGYSSKEGVDLLEFSGSYTVHDMLLTLANSYNFLINPLIAIKWYLAKSLAHDHKSIFLRNSI